MLGGLGHEILSGPMHLPQVNERGLIVAVIDLQLHAALARNDRFDNGVSETARVKRNRDAVSDFEHTFGVV